MTTLVDPVALGPPDFVRDQWHRPLIIPPDGGKPRPYTRASLGGQDGRGHLQPGAVGAAQRRLRHGPRPQPRRPGARPRRRPVDVGPGHQEGSATQIVEDAAGGRPGAPGRRHRHRRAPDDRDARPWTTGGRRAVRGRPRGLRQRPDRRRADRRRRRVPAGLRRPGDGRHRRPDPAPGRRRAS